MIYQPRDMTGHSSQPTVAGLMHYQTEPFLLDHLKNANLQRPGSTALRARDLRFQSNEEFWRALLRGERLALRWVELRHFQVVDWFPRTPGLYHTPRARQAREEARAYIYEENGIRIYKPRGKTHMIEGGIGSLRFKPLIIGGDEFWLCTATSDGNCHSGVPLAIPNLLTGPAYLHPLHHYKITGQVRFLPEFLEHHFYHMTKIPQIYVLVDSIERLDIGRGKEMPVRITPMVFFTAGEQLGLSERDNVTYVTCYSDSFDELDRAAEWLEWYIEQYGGEIITNFDEQRPIFEYAPFSLQNVITGNLDYHRLRRFHIDHADIIVDSIQRIHAEAVTMSKIEIKLGDGTVIHGDFVVANSIRDSFNQAESADISDELKGLLKELAKEVGKMSEALPKETSEQVARDLQALVAEASSKKPRKQWWQLSIEGLKRAAKDAGEIGKPVLELAAKVVPILVALSL